MLFKSGTVGIISGFAVLTLSASNSFATEPTNTQQNTIHSPAPAVTYPLPSSQQPPQPLPSQSGTTTPGATSTYTTTTTDVLAETAIPYGSYQTDVSSFKRDLESTADIENAMNMLGTHNAQRLASGWLAYSALLAAQSENFRKGVEDTDAYHGRERLLNGMRNSPAYTLSLAGAEDAMSRALGAGKADARRLDIAGEQVKQQAYTLQSLGWAKARLSGRPTDHANQIRTAATTGRPQAGNIRSIFLSPDVDTTISSANALAGTTSLWDRLSQQPAGVGFQQPIPVNRGFQSRPRQYTIRGEREVSAGNIATLAALKILGETQARTAFVSSALEDQQTQACFNQAQLNLLQCVSASRNVFERPFCIGVHALKEIGECIGDVSY